jgi:O6-methylguanine-DNA--protein-cysteine methyltransferase
MSETIRLAWAISSLGEFMVAMSDRGLVAVEFGSDHDATEEALRARFPNADIIAKQQELRNIIERVGQTIEEPALDPAAPLDLRGTPYEIGVWSMLRAIPPGETTNYGALAAHGQVPPPTEDPARSHAGKAQGDQGAPADEHKAQEFEGLRFSEPALRASVRSMAAKLDQPAPHQGRGPGARKVTGFGRGACH